MPKPEPIHPNLAALLRGRNKLRHNIVVEESDVPGVFGIYCACGDSTWTPWGAEHAEEIAKLHLFVNGVPAQRVIR